jgi:FAD binding domain-containing protein
MTVLVAGAGIGGLTLALSLHQIGVPCRVFESVERIEPLGVGINTLPHAVRELTELGLADRLAATAIETAEQAYFSKHGKPVWSEPRGAPPATTGRNSPSTAARCRCCCLRRCLSGWARTRCWPATTWRAGTTRRPVCARASCTARAATEAARTMEPC